jgi:ribonucleotide reductase beta subunit family protein with ferritin-like domain
MYSLLIDTYIDDKVEKQKLLEASSTIPAIQKKADWAKQWLNAKEADFTTRLVAFAVVEGIFFSGAFCSIFWLKKSGLMPGLTTSNEFIARDEGMHRDMACLIYNKYIVNKLDEKEIEQIIKDAVEVEKEFIDECLPYNLTGMNKDLMKQYIEFVADRLSVQLGYDKIYNSANPFDFMELISIESKVNFFERTNSEYSLANKTIDTDVFEFNADF